MGISAAPPDDPVTTTAANAAVRHFSQHGYENTTAGDLADAIGMSRSTFFRRFGSKEDVVFAGHDLALVRLEQTLATADGPASDVLAVAVLEVMHMAIRDADAAKLRWEIIRNTPSLRERELVFTHRYERVFAQYLRRVAASGTPEWVPTAVAAAVVAVHNAALRRWLRDTDARAIGALEREISELMGRFTPWYGGESGASRVLIATFDVDTSPGEVLRAIGEQLG